jgi:hypothetical protein
VTTPNIGDGRLVRVCDVCGGVDDHPRHQVVGDPGTGPPNDVAVSAVLEADLSSDMRVTLLNDLYDTSLLLRHLDCCRNTGCPDGTCDTQTAGAETLRGAELLRHLTGKGD